MSNLLPEKNKKKVINEFILRFVIISLVFVLLAVVIFAISLLPSYTLAKDKGEDTLKEIELSKQLSGFKEKSLDMNKIQGESQKISVLGEKEEILVSEIVAEIVDQKPSTVKITGFFYEVERDEAGKKSIKISVRGIAKERSSLIDFTKNLDSVSDFTSVELPVSNLTKGEELDFSILILSKVVADGIK